MGGGGVSGAQWEGGGVSGVSGRGEESAGVSGRGEESAGVSGISAYNRTLGPSESRSRAGRCGVEKACRSQDRQCNTGFPRAIGIDRVQLATRMVGKEILYVYIYIILILANY